MEYYAPELLSFFATYIKVSSSAIFGIVIEIGVHEIQADGT